MTIYYSKTTKGFYDNEIHGTNLPEDVVEIPLTLHRDLILGQEAGKDIHANEHGFPELRDAPELTEADLNLAHNNDIIAQIKDLELNLQPRAMRDVLLYEDITRLIALDEQISELRAQLK